MILPPGVGNIHYRQYRLEVMHQGPGWKVFIYPPGAVFGLSETPYTKKDEREAVIAQAKKAVDADIEKRASDTISYVPK